MERDSAELSKTSTGVSTDWAVFRGPEGGEIDIKSLKRIQSFALLTFVKTIKESMGRSQQHEFTK